MRATIRSSASISMTSSTRRWNRIGLRSLPEKRTRVRARRSPRVAIDRVDVSSAPMPAAARAVRDLGISTVSDAGVHHATAIVTRNVVGHQLRHGVPVAGPEDGPEAFVHLACRVFQPRRRPAELVEPRERGVEVCLVEQLAAVDQVAVDRQHVDHSPLGVEALLRGPR